jgi:putative peptide zinc metalloprotease protein
VLKDLRTGGFTRMTDADAELLELVDGLNSLHELIAESERRFGPSGAARLARLLGDLGERGLLEGVVGGRPAPARAGRVDRLFRPRELAFDGVGDSLDRIYRRGGFLFFTWPALVLLSAVAAAGIAVFVFLIVHRYGTPFVVASRIGLGGIVFLAGRFLVVGFHELAHGLTVTSFGRRVPRAGFKLLLIFPYAFVDTSDAWFEPRSRRLAISAAGPFSDLVVGGAFSLVALTLPGGTTRDIVFQLAFAAYVGAFFNLNPFLDRDGYNLLVDLLREPGLRRRSRERLARRLSGAPAPPDAERRIVAVYAVAALAWSIVGVAFAVFVSTRYWGRFESIASKQVIVGVFAVFYGLMLLPVAIGIGRPLLERRRAAVTEGVDSAAA